MPSASSRAYPIGSEVVAIQVLGLTQPFYPPEVADLFISYGYTVLALPGFRRLEMVVNDITGEVGVCVLVPPGDPLKRARNGPGEPGNGFDADYPGMTEEDIREVAKVMGK